MVLEWHLDRLDLRLSFTSCNGRSFLEIVNDSDDMCEYFRRIWSCQVMDPIPICRIGEIV